MLATNDGCEYELDWFPVGWGSELKDAILDKAQSEAEEAYENGHHSF